MAELEQQVRHTPAQSGRRGEEIRVGGLVRQPGEDHRLLVQESAPLGQVPRVQGQQEGAQRHQEEHLFESSARAQ